MKRHLSLWADRSGVVGIVFALALIPLIMAIGAAIDVSRLADGRAVLQRAADNAALSGASAYTLNATAYNTLAITVATSSFCNATATVPASFTLVATAGTTPQTCNGAAGPTVAAVTGGYQQGIPGVYPGSGCTATTTVVPGIVCGFIVTVSASATMNPIFPPMLGGTKTIQVTAIAANPFLNLGNSIKAQIQGSAYNVNSVWVYPLLLDANGNPDFSTNGGALPSVTNTISVDASPSGCNDNPLQTLCGAYTMLADTAYANPSCTAASPCMPNGPSGARFVNGVVQNVAAPAAIITATTPIGIAFESIAGGGLGYGYFPGQLPKANGCIYPAAATYGTYSQEWDNTLNSSSGPPTGNPALAWNKVTHWFFSSYLANGLPPSQGEVASQTQLSSYTYPSNGVTVQYNLDIPTIGIDLTGSFLPSLASCANTAGNGNSYDAFVTTSYPSTGADNGNLFILKQSAGAAYIAPAATGAAYQYYAPAATPGAQYAALSCQSYGNSVFTFYWNDMGGSQGYGDDLDYNNGTVRITCSGSSFVVLIG